MDKGRRWVEGSIYDFKRVIWTYGYVLWTNQLSSNIPDSDKQNLIGYNQYRRSGKLYW